MTTQLAPTPVFRGTDAFGLPLYLGQLGTFVAGTNTPQVTYKDSLGIATNTNPVILNARGECNLWLDTTKAYKLVLSDALGNLIWTVDNVTIGNANPSYNVIPTTDNLYNLGSATFAWANIYAKTNIFVGSSLIPVIDQTAGGIGYNPRTSAEVSAGVTPVSFFYAEGNAFRYMAAAQVTSVVARDSVQDVTSPLNAALSLVGIAVYLPAGTYKVTSNLAIPVCTSISGAGFLSSIIKTVGCTVGLSISSGTTDMLLRDFQMLGDNTASARGIVYGDGASVLNSVLSRNLWVTGYTGASSVGIDIRNATEATFLNCNVNGNTLGGRCKAGATASTPTTVNFYACNFASNTTQGFLIQQGFAIGFHGTVFQSNTNEGCSIVPDATHKAVQVTFDSDCWFEGNWGSSPTQFQLFVDSSVANLPVTVALVSVTFQGGLGTANAVQFNGTSTTFIWSEDVIFPNLGALQPGAIKVSGGAIGQIKFNAASLPNYALNVADAGGTATNVYDAYNAWTAYTPVYASDIGNQAATFSGGTVTTTLARYKRTGKILHITLQFSGTLNAVTPNYISVTTPGIPLQNDQTYSPACVSNAGTFETGVVRSQAAGTLRFHRANFVNFGSAAAILGLVSVVVETA